MKKGKIKYNKNQEKNIKSKDYFKENEEEKEIIAGRNSIIEAINSGREINKILFQEGIEKGRIKSIFNIANEKKIICQQVPKQKLDNLTKEHHQGVVAFVSPYNYYDLDKMLQELKNIDKTTTILILDHIEDPHNLGAIIRTAAAGGVENIIIPKRRAAVVSAAAVKASAGAIEYVKISRVGSILDTIKKLKEKGFWIAGTTLNEKSINYTNIAKDVPLAIIVGSEGKGLNKAVEKSCDFLYHIKMLGKTQSLNVSVASGIILFERIKNT